MRNLFNIVCQKVTNDHKAKYEKWLDEMLKKKDFSLIDELVSAMDVNKEKVGCIINLLETIVDEDFVSEVKSDKRNLVIPAGQSIKIKGRVKTENIDSPIPVIFEPDEVSEWPEVLKINESVLLRRLSYAG